MGCVEAEVSAVCSALNSGVTRMGLPTDCHARLDGRYLGCEVMPIVEGLVTTSASCEMDSRGGRSWGVE